MIFDIKDPDTTFPVAAPLPIAPFFSSDKEELQLCIFKINIFRSLPQQIQSIGLITNRTIL
jgi:hypothetical protein